MRMDWKDLIDGLKTNLNKKWKKRKKTANVKKFTFCTNLCVQKTSLVTCSKYVVVSSCFCCSSPFPPTFRCWLFDELSPSSRQVLFFVNGEALSIKQIHTAVIHETSLCIFRDEKQNVAGRGPRVALCLKKLPFAKCRSPRENASLLFHERFRLIENCKNCLRIV